MVLRLTCDFFCYYIKFCVVEHCIPFKFFYLFLLQVTAEDKDFGDFGSITYDIFSDEMKEYFAIDKIKGEIVTKVRLDREVRKTYEIPVIATDGGGRSGFTIVKVKVGDLNDNAPDFYLREYKVAIHGNLSINGTFLQVCEKIHLILLLNCGFYNFIFSTITKFFLI